MANATTTNSTLEWENTCGMSHRSQRSRVTPPGYYTAINIALLAFTVAYIVGTTIWFLVERKKTLFLYKRSTFGILASAFGGSLIVMIGPIRSFHPETFPCDLILLCFTLCVPLNQGPVALRLFQFRNQLEWNRHLARTSLNKLNDAAGNAVVPLPHSPESGLAVSPGSPGGAGGETTAAAAAGAAGASPKRKRSVYHGATSSVRMGGSNAGTSVDDHTSQFSGSRFQHFTLGLWFRSSDWFPVILYVGLATFYFFLLSLPFLVTQPYYLHGCVGCLYNPPEQTASAAASFVVGGALVYFVWDIHAEKDPLEIRSEIISMLPVAMMVGSVGLTGILVDAWAMQGTLGDSGVVEFEWFLVLSVLWIHHSMCPLQVYKSRRMTSMDGIPSKAEFRTLLNNVHFKKMFEDHCVSEFSTENIKFYESVVTYEAQHPNSSAQDRINLAMSTYNAFIPPGSIMEINVKSTIREHIVQQIGRPDHVLQDVPVDVFAPAKEEILDLMYRDSLVRWARSPEYKEWASKAIVVKNDGHVAVFA